MTGRPTPPMDTAPGNAEQALRGAGGAYSKSDSIFAPHIVRDGRLHTGQNPASSEALACELARDIRS